MRAAVKGLVVLCLWALKGAHAAPSEVKDPLSVPIKLYGLALAMSLIGGFASWYHKVLKNEIPRSSIFHGIGELTTSAFAGMVTFFLCQWAGSPAMLTAPLCGIAGWMGTKLLSWYEKRALDAIAKKAEVLNG